jgi:transposase-like protein
MTKTKAIITAEELKQALTQDSDFLKPRIQLVLQEVLEAEMEDTLGVGKGGLRVVRATAAAITRGD